MDQFEGAIRKTGVEIYVETEDGLKKGTAVIYPMRYHHKQWGGVERSEEGRTDAKRYFMFCTPQLLEKANFGAYIYEGRNKYRLIWKDEFVCRIGGYVKACLRKVVEEKGDDEQIC